MDLLCNEKEMFKDFHHFEQPQSQPMQVMHMEPQINTACVDPTFLSERCLENLLKSEETHPTLNFYDNPQCEITPQMRQIVAEWMMEVSLSKKKSFSFIQQFFFFILFPFYFGDETIKIRIFLLKFK